MAGSLRIYRAPPARLVAPGLPTAPGAQAPAPTASVDDYVQKVVKLIPSEVVGAYLVGAAMVAEGPARTAEKAWWAAACLVAVIVLRLYLTRSGADPVAPGRRFQWDAVTVSAISFAVWVHAMGDQLPGLSWLSEHRASQALLLWSIIAPLVVRGDPVPPAATADAGGAHHAVPLSQSQPGEEIMEQLARPTPPAAHGAV
jgi:hypothetical protein